MAKWLNEGLSKLRQFWEVCALVCGHSGQLRGQ